MQIILLLMCNKLSAMADVLKTVVCLFVVYLSRLVPTSCKYAFNRTIVIKDLIIDSKPLYYYCY